MQVHFGRPSTKKMKELAYPYTDSFQTFSNPVEVLKDSLSLESNKFQFDRFNRHDTMNEELLKTQKDCTVEEELEHFNKILKQHGECQSRNVHKKVDDYSQSDMGADIPSKMSMQSIATREPDLLLDKLHDKKVNLVLVATSLDESDVVTKLESTLDPAESSVVVLKFDDTTNDISHNDNAYATCRPSTETHEDQQERDLRRTGATTTRKTSEQGTGERYRKRRTSNNEAAKKSRDGRKAHFEWTQSRIKVLEEENALLRTELDNLTQEVLDKEKGLGK